MGFLDYLQSDMEGIKFTKKKLLKEGPSKEPEGTNEERGLIGPNEHGLGNFGSNVEIKRVGRSLVINFLDVKL